MHPSETGSLIFFGGTFDPVHSGHVDCVQRARAFDPQATIWVAPAYSPVSLNDSDRDGLKKPSFSFEKRLQLLKDVFAEEPSVYVSDLEKTLRAPNYTIQTIQEIYKQNPGKKISLLIGWDQWLSFPKWHRVSELLTIVDLLVVPREQEWGSKGAVFELEGGLQKLGASAKGAVIRLLAGNTTVISSQSIRNYINTKQEDSRILQGIPRVVKKGIGL